MTKTRLMIVAMLICAVGWLSAADQKQMYVTVKTTQIRATPGYLGKPLGNLNYGDKVTVLDQPADAPKDWLKVTGPDGKLQGWINASSVSSKQVALKAGATASQSASSGDGALAGKGFNSDVEQQYKDEQHLDYTWVDKMEAFDVPPDQVSRFLTQGGLSEQGGAQ